MKTPYFFCNPKLLSFIIAFWFFSFVIIGQARGQYYVEDKYGNLKSVNADPNQARPKEWKYKLYKYGEPACTSRNWGVISNKSLALATMELKSSQQFEDRYQAFFNSSIPEQLTSKNYCGPIAVFKPENSIGITQTNKLVEFANFINKARSD